MREQLKVYFLFFSNKRENNLKFRKRKLRYYFMDQKKIYELKIYVDLVIVFFFCGNDFKMYRYFVVLQEYKVNVGRRNQ